MLWRSRGFPPLWTWTPKPTRPVAWNGKTGLRSLRAFSGSDLASRVQSTEKNLWIVPSELDLAAAELELSQQDSYLLNSKMPREPKEIMD